MLAANAHRLSTVTVGHVGPEALVSINGTLIGASAKSTMSPNSSVQVLQGWRDCCSTRVCVALSERKGRTYRDHEKWAETPPHCGRTLVDTRMTT